MNKEFISKSIKMATYAKKVGTKGSYYSSIGTWMLPERLSVVLGEGIIINKTGRGLLPKYGTLKARFRKAEESPYKRFPPYCVSTSLWRVEGHPSMLYGTIGLSDEEGNISSDNGDLLILRTSNYGETFTAFIFSGFAGSNSETDYLKQAVEYINRL